MTSLLYRLFKIGAIPAQFRPVLESEGVRLLEEGIPVIVTYRNLRSPRRLSSFRRMRQVGALALTHQRILGTAFHQPILNLPWSEKRLQQVEWSLGGEGELWAAFEAGLFRPEWSGRIEIAFRCTQASRAFTMIQYEMAQRR